MSDFEPDTTNGGTLNDGEELPYRRWLSGLHDGLVGFDTRAESEGQMLSHVGVRPACFAAFVSGVVADLLRSLPAEDPWRHTIVVEGAVTSVRGDPFGTWADAADLHSRSYPDVRLDHNLAALHPALTKSAAWVIHLGGQGWSVAYEALGSAIDGGISAEELFADGSAAMRWVMHRRRAYTGADDPYPSVVTAAWVRRAIRVETGQPWDEARRARLAKQEKVPDGLHAWLTAR
jgi:hypothetical protein